MTYDEALKIAKGKMLELVYEAEIATEKRKKRINEEYAMLMKACEAMEKQVLQRPNCPWDTEEDECLNCGHWVNGEKFCSECGQALDWSDEE